ncbi:hypothetical protein KDH_03190 [Dictyobacter sp. S3.2.2.5]|uniref:Glycoside hydrolase family 5 domain-containing protein n=1 Tax=Dictyobacter halimunensis TaxID=3026934 RepID=A0ABQ6FIM9_9CHLR|nr:hypothetical protein KDH_03190 [Dictyobacter sp. S3.2.2.5]
MMHKSKPTDTTLIGQESPFGIVWGPLYGHMGVKASVFMPQIHQLGAHLTRLFLFWDQIEPERGCFIWDAVDTFRQQLGPHDEAWITINSSSSWGTRHATSFQPPSPALNAEDYYCFISTLVSRCQGRVRYWQDDNEPTNPLLWEGTVEDYKKQLKTFSRAVRDADPNAVIILAGAVDAFHAAASVMNPDAPAEQNFFEQLLRENAADFDVFDLHLYGEPYAIIENVTVVRQKMATLGYQKPIFVGEYNGPSFFNFAENLPILQGIFMNMMANSQANALEQATQGNAIAELYAQMSNLPPQAQMFMEGCPPELEQKHHRINCRELVTRCVMALSAGAQKVLCWNLANEKIDPNNLMHLLFDKHKLVDYERGEFKQPYPAAETFLLMTQKLGGVEEVRRIELAKRPDTYLFEVKRWEQKPMFIIWERRDTFSGEDEPPIPFTWAWPTPQARASDVFGQQVSVQVQDGQIHLPISITPVFVEA